MSGYQCLAMCALHLVVISPIAIWAWWLESRTPEQLEAMYPEHGRTQRAARARIAKLKAEIAEGEARAAKRGAR